MERFQGRTVIVTGAASGIGAEMVRLFADEGALVVAGDLSKPAAKGIALAIEIDVSQAAPWKALVDAALAKSGRIDVLCNNAGIGSTTDVLNSSEEEWDKVFAVNVRGTFLGTRAVLPSMIRERRGVIVNTASIAGMVGLRDRAAYCASKAAVIGFTRQVAVQYANDNVRCNCICPGTIDSPWVGKLIDSADDPAKRRSDLIARQPLGRLGTSTEAAHAALYLASDEAAFATGTALVIDGGITAA